MKIFAVGLNHKGTPVEVREKVAISEQELGAALASFEPADDPLERVLLSTCNRVELYLSGDTLDPKALLCRLFEKFRGVDSGKLQDHLYLHEGEDAVLHLFRVVGGLDSMVVGETQILGQVKRAYLAAHQAGATSRVLNRLFQHSLSVAKRIHTSTSLASCPVSTSTVSAALAGRIFQDLSTVSLMVLGAGETGRLALEAFRERGVRKILVANRTLERAEAAARELQGRAISLDRLAESLPEADLVVSSVASEEFVLRPESVAASQQRRRRPVLVIDLSVPRSVDPRIGELENVFLYNIDDLQSIAADNMARREKQVARAEEIVREEAAAFLGRSEEDLKRALHAHFQKVAREELGRSLEALRELPEPEREKARRVLEGAISAVVERLISGPLKGLGETRAAAELLRRLFGL